MDRVLGRTAGNAVEVRESIDHLTGAASDPRLLEVTFGLCEQLLRLKGLDGDPRGRARSRARRPRPSRAWWPRSAARRTCSSAPTTTCPAAPVTVEAQAERPGVVAGIDVRAVGLAVIDLGGGRRREDDAIDHAVGLTEVAAPGERVGPQGRPLAIVHARDEDSAAHAAEALAAAFRVGDRVLDENPAVLEIVTQAS